MADLTGCWGHTLPERAKAAEMKSGTHAAVPADGSVLAGAIVPADEHDDRLALRLRDQSPARNEAWSPALAKAVQTSSISASTRPLTMNQHDANEAAVILHGPDREPARYS